MIQWGWTEPVQEVDKVPPHCQLLLVMATCHELNIVGGEILGKIIEEQVEIFPQPSTYVFCKGSTEKVEVVLCFLTSLSSDYCSILNLYAFHGYKMIALAGSVLLVDLAGHSRLGLTSPRSFQSNHFTAS